MARHLGCTEKELAVAAPDARLPSLRGEEVERSGCRVILDCYNANPLSMEAALAGLADRPGPHAVVLGEMLELGEETGARHRDLGRRLAGMDLDRIMFVGQSGARVRDGFLDAGGEQDRIRLFPDANAARVDFAAALACHGTLLLKASRGMALETLLEALDD